MRLIDADAFIEYLGLDAENAREDNVGEIVTLEDFDRQPTAFDKEKVIEKIKDESGSERFEDVGISGNVYGHYSKEVIDTEEAIEIVEKGGIE